MTPGEDMNRRMLRARDAMDRSFAEPLDVATLARIAHVSRAHFSRSFRQTFGETPHRYLQRRRIERAMALLRSTDQPVIEVALAVGFESHSTFSRTFREIVGHTPSDYRGSARPAAVPVCFHKAWLRPSSFGQAPSRVRVLA
jgi:AraC-like DNA-binding protein